MALGLLPFFFFRFFLLCASYHATRTPICHSRLNSLLVFIIKRSLVFKSISMPNGNLLRPKAPVICNGCKYIQPYYNSGIQTNNSTQTAFESMSSNWNERLTTRLAGCQVMQPHHIESYLTQKPCTHNVIHYGRTVVEDYFAREKKTLYATEKWVCERWRYGKKTELEKEEANSTRNQGPTGEGGGGGFEWRHTWLSKT